MPDLSEQISDYVGSVCPPLTLEDLRSRVDRGPLGPRKPSRPMVVMSVGVAIAVVAVVVAVMLPVIFNSPRTTNAAAATLAEAALVAASQRPLPTAGKHQYLYYEVTDGSVLLNTYAPTGQQPIIIREVQTTQTWVAPNGSGRQYVTSKDVPLLASQRQAWLADGSRLATPPGPSDTIFPTTFADRQPIGGPMTRGRNSKWYLSYPQTSFPTQPTALKRAIKRFYRVKGGGAVTIFELAGGVLQVDPSPSLRAAVFEMVKELPGVKLLGTIRDMAGRTGVGVAIDSSGVRHILIFNPKTSAVLGEKAIATRARTFAGVRLPQGTLLGFETFGPVGVTLSFETPAR